MDAFRYAIALFITAVAPGVYFYWFSIHPFIRFWRKIGAGRTVAIHFFIACIFASVVILYRDTLLGVEYGSHLWLNLLAVVFIIISYMLRSRLAKHFSVKTLLGFPELAPETHNSTLITEGIYARIRHPRYAELIFGFIAYALFANYLATYVVAVLSVFWVLILVRLEEKELRDRFGEAYDAYCEQVPRFIPKWKS